MSVESEVSESRPPIDLESLDLEEPDVGFQVGVGVFCGTILAGVVTTMLALAEADAATLLGTFPTAVTGGIVVGSLLARGARGFPERLGARRWRWLYALLPAAGFAAVAAVTTFTSSVGGRVTVVTLVSAAVVAVAGLLLVGMARNRYVDAITTDEPAATWRWRRTGRVRWEYVMGVGLLVVGVGQVVAGGESFGVLWIVYGAALLVGTAAQGRWFDDRQDEAIEYAPEFAVHDAGLVKSRGRSKTLVPWTKVTGVELTADELVIERRSWPWAIRCDTDVIDDPQAVSEAIEARRGA